MKVKEVLNIAKKRELVFAEVEEYDFSVGGMEGFLKTFKISKLELAYNIISTPILVLHELLHLIFGLLMFRKVEDISISNPNEKNFHAIIEFKNPFATTLVSSMIINLAPILILLSAIFLVFVNVWFLILLAYVIFTYKFSLPSKQDLFHVLLFKFKKEFENEDDYMTFGAFCMINLSIKDILVK